MSEENAAQEEQAEVEDFFAPTSEVESDAGFKSLLPQDEDSAPSETSEEPAEEAEASEEKPDQSNIDKRFAEITRARREAEREAESLRQELEYLKTRSEQGKVAVTDLKEPVYEDFDTDQDYYRAMARYEVKREAAEQKLQADKAKQREQEESLKRKMYEDIQRVKEAGMEDFDTVAFFPLPNRYTGEDPHAHLRELIMSADNPAGLAYELGSLNRSELNDLLSKSVASQALFVGKLDAKISAREKPKLRTKSSGPRPTTPVSSNAGASKDLAKMSTDEYMRYMNKAEDEGRFRVR